MITIRGRCDALDALAHDIAAKAEPGRVVTAETMRAMAERYQRRLDEIFSKSVR